MHKHKISIGSQNDCNIETRTNWEWRLWSFCVDRCDCLQFSHEHFYRCVTDIILMSIHKSLLLFRMLSNLHAKGMLLDTDNKRTMPPLRWWQRNQVFRPIRISSKMGPQIAKTHNIAKFKITSCRRSYTWVPMTLQFPSFHVRKNVNIFPTFLTN